MNAKKKHSNKINIWSSVLQKYPQLILILVRNLKFKIIDLKHKHDGAVFNALFFYNDLISYR